MTEKETIQVLQSIEDRAVDFPYMTACDWVAIAAAKRHLENSLKVKEVEEPSKDLEEAAKFYAATHTEFFDSEGKPHVTPAFIAGAKWQEEQIMKDAIEREVKEEAGGYPYIDATELYDYDNDKPLAKAGDKIKVVFIKDK